VTDRLIRITTALAVVAVAVVAAIISYQHAYELVRSHGEAGMTARPLPFTVNGLIWAASMVVLDASRWNQPVQRLAAWSLGAGIVATVGANLTHSAPESTKTGAVPLVKEAPPELTVAPTLEQTVRARHKAGHSQRAIAENSTSTAARSSASSTKPHKTLYDAGSRMGPRSINRSPPFGKVALTKELRSIGRTPSRPSA
jgi:hypothetical protein